MGLLDRLQSTGSVKATILSESSFFNEKEKADTGIPIINAAFTGGLDGGVVPGLTVIAGPSRHFKSNIGLLCVKAYLDKYKDAVCLFYDSEFGITGEYLQNMGIDSTRVLHIPVLHLEQLKFDIAKKLEEIAKNDKVIIFCDSLGNLASKKEAEDAVNENTAQDMTRAKVIKGLFRIITPHLTMKGIPCIVINHVYMEQGLYPKAIISGGTGVMLSANTAFIVGRSQEKDGTDVVGWNFTLNVEKSRFVKEKSKLQFQVTYTGGIDKYSGLLDLALESGHCFKPSNGWYQKKGHEQKHREKDTHTEAFWGEILNDPTFNEFVKQKYSLPTSKSIFEETEVIDMETGEIFSET